MKYYEMHEIVYQKLQEKNGLSWDNSLTFEGMFSHDTNVYLEKLLPKVGKKLEGLEVLDLGTGTGTSALFCAKKGAIVTGVEISKAAIEIAERHKKALGLEVAFQVGDILALDLPERFDLVIDSTVLHCLVGKDDRKKFYQTTERHLKRGGHLFINTMIADGDMSKRFSNDFFLFQDDILWSLGVSEIQERKEIEGKSYFPHRTILSKEDQLKEFEDQGFKVLVQEFVRSEDQSLSMVALLQSKI